MSQARKPWQVKLDPYDIVYCSFPALPINEPAPKPRPALVLAVNDDRIPQMLYVASCTTQKIDKKFSGDFTIAPADGDVFKKTGLREETKIVLSSATWLPYDDMWFKPDPASKSKTPRMGALNVELNQEVKNRLRSATAVCTFKHLEKKP